MLQGCTRLAVKLDFIAGLFIKALEATGTIEFRGIQASIGEIIAWRNTFWALTDAMCNVPVPSAGGSVLPEHRGGVRVPHPLEHRDPRRSRRSSRTRSRGAMIVQPSPRVDWKTESCGPLLDQFYRGSNGYEGGRQDQGGSSFSGMRSGASSAADTSCTSARTRAATS